MLKLNAPGHFEAETEAGALASWNGEGAVRLLARDDERRALLLERCVPGTRLWDAGVDEEEVVAMLLPRLQIEVAPNHAFRLLASEAERWADEVPRRYEEADQPFERALLDFALDVDPSTRRHASSSTRTSTAGASFAPSASRGS